MASKTPQPDSLSAILSVIEETRGDSDHFAETLRHMHIPHLSFSQVSTVEFCHYRYFLQYEQLVDPVPVPDYFTKGKLLHQLIATTYANLARDQRVDPEPYYGLIRRHYQGDAETHLQNAVAVHLGNLWQDCQVVAVEEPFVMLIDERLPPVVGVIDLILKQNGNYILIDHKTGRDFYPQDELQMAIYVEYARQRYGGSNFRFFYEHYRWVKNLQRIRKPAFQRTEVILPSYFWQLALARIQSGFRAIEGIKTTQEAKKEGECFRCPYQKICWQ
jgi:hypothetical protein